MNAIARRKRDLEQYAPASTMDPAQLDLYWETVLRQDSERPLEVKREKQDSPFPTIAVDKLTYKGYDHTPLHGWFMVPRQQPEGSAKPPCIVLFQGYTGDRGLPERYAAWLLLGYAVLALDARGQGGETGNEMKELYGSSKGWVSMGVLDKEHSYYQALALDAVRGVNAAAQQPEIDPARVAVVGGSQGGGLSLLAAALNPRVAAVVADIPNMCHMDYGLMHSTGSLTEIAQYLKRHPQQLERVLDTLAHFDMLNLAPRITAPLLMSVGWKDTVCIPETIYAVYNKLQCSKQILDYPFNGHETGEEHGRKVMEFLQRTLG